MDFYATPDFSAESRRVHIGPTTKIAILKGVLTSTAVDATGKKVATQWLRITIDGKQGYIAGEADFAAIGLQPVG
ncbi:MAG TPA: hypothetical protein VE077_08050 [Candidatus Methylomirabilis sp.]|nr:hypothetical protein [Candidatus Methylomirabilis sp.]